MKNGLVVHYLSNREAMKEMPPYPHHALTWDELIKRNIEIAKTIEHSTELGEAGNAQADKQLKQALKDLKAWELQKLK